MWSRGGAAEQRSRRAGPRPRPGGAGTCRHALTRERGVRIGAAPIAGGRRTGMPDEERPVVAGVSGDEPSTGTSRPRTCRAGRSVRADRRAGGPPRLRLAVGRSVRHPYRERGVQNVVEGIGFRRQMIPAVREDTTSNVGKSPSRETQAGRKPVPESRFWLHAAALPPGSGGPERTRAFLVGRAVLEAVRRPRWRRSSSLSRRGCCADRTGPHLLPSVPIPTWTRTYG